jgi:hypothetical protein
MMDITKGCVCEERYFNPILTKYRIEFMYYLVPPWV